MDGYGQYSGHFPRNWPPGQGNDKSNNFEKNQGFLPSPASSYTGNLDKMAFKPYAGMTDAEAASLSQYYASVYRPRLEDIQTSAKTDIDMSNKLGDRVEDKIRSSAGDYKEKMMEIHVRDKRYLGMDRIQHNVVGSRNTASEWMDIDEQDLGEEKDDGFSNSENDRNSEVVNLKIDRVVGMSDINCLKSVDYERLELVKANLEKDLELGKRTCMEIPETSIDRLYTCGGCMKEYGTICKLHAHLQDHDTGGSYHYDHHTRTAFPKYDSTCNSTQTEGPNLKRKDTIKKKPKPSISPSEKPENNFDLEKAVSDIKTEVEDDKLYVKFYETALTELSAIANANAEEEDSSAVKTEVKDTTEGTGVTNENTIIRNNDENEANSNDENEDEANNDDTDEYSPAEMLTKKKIKKKIQVKISRTKRGSKIGNSKLVKKKPQHLQSISCKVCSKKFTCKLHLRQHCRSEHKKDASVCVLCSEKFESENEMRTHRKEQHSNMVHQCELCSKILSTKAMLEGHYLVHKGIKPFACDVCVPKREFTRKSQLMAHMQTHSTVNHLQCEFCGKPFNARYLMINHVKHCAGIKPHKCDFCAMSFVSNHCLQRHRRTHTGEKPFVCEVCAFASSNASCLARHMRTHTGEKPFICKYCHQAFAAPGALKKHVRIHTLEKPYSCSYCSKAFTQKWNLKTHERQHTGETPYKCSVCGIGYKQNVLLKTHMKMHYDAMYNFNSALSSSSSLQQQQQQQALGTTSLIHRAFTEM